ncbi:MAG: hypothetical protein NTV22_02730, partial [bacterium]|nr:hypothetical protein [bacterium]
MKKILVLTLTVAFCSALAGMAAPFTPGNLVVYRIGDGVVNLASSGAKVFLDEFTTNGALVQSVEIPSAAGDSNQLVAAGTSTSEGLITRSTDTQRLLITGYRPNPFPYSSSLSATAGSVVNRVIGRVSIAGALETMALADFASGSSPRAACSEDGTKVWMGGGAGSVRYAAWGDTASSQVLTNGLTNMRQVHIFDGQVYATTQSGGGGNTAPLGAVGEGLPTNNAAFIALPGLPVLTGSGMYGFYFCDLSGSEPGVDTLYIADDTVDYIRKYCKASGTWTQYGTMMATNYIGLAGKVNGTEVALYTTTGGSSTNGGGTLASVIDTSGYQGTLAGSLTTLSTASPFTAYRGVAMAPLPEPAVLGLLAAAL